MASSLSRRFFGVIVALLGFCSAANAAELLPNPGFAGVSNAGGLKPQYAADASFTVPTSGDADACTLTQQAANNLYTATYTYGTEEGAAYIEVQLKNASSCTMNYSLRMLSAVGGNIQVQAGARYTLAGAIKIISHDAAAGGALALALNSATAYLGGEGVDYSPHLKGVYQPLSITYQVVGSNAASLPVSVGPHVGIWNIPVGGGVQFRLKAPSLQYSAPPTGVTLRGLVNRQVVVKPGKRLKLSVDYDLVPNVNYANGKSKIQLLDANGVIKHAETERSLRADFGQSAGGWGPDIDGWSFAVPGTLAPGVYTIRYTVTNLGTMVAGPHVSALGGGQYILGQVVVDDQAGIYIGQHFHRYPSNVDYPGPLGVSFNFVRTHNSNLNISTISTADTDTVNVPNWWKPAGVDKDLLKEWANRHAPAGASATTRFALITFSGVPTWASSRPTETYVDSKGESTSGWMQAGQTSPPASLAAYRQMVIDTIAAIGKDRVMGVECWNEPDDRLISFSPLASLTDLADICKTIHEAAQSVDTNILTFCPQPMDTRYLSTLLSATTSESIPRPIHDYCHVIGAHNYNAAGSDAAGRGYTQTRLIDFVKAIRDVAAAKGISKAIAITEMGFPDGGAQAQNKWRGTKFSDRTSEQRGEVVYQTLASAAELGVVFPALYSYDIGATSDPYDRQNEFPKGYLGNQLSVGAGQGNLHVVTFDDDVNEIISSATTDLAQATSVGLKSLALGVYVLPSATTVVMAKDVQSQSLNFSVAVVNRGQQAAKGAVIATATSATTYSHWSGSGTAAPSIVVIDSISGGPSGSTCSKSAGQWTCRNFDIPPGATVTFQAQGRVAPSAAQLGYIKNGWRYHFYHGVAASFDGQTGVTPSAVTPVITVQRQ